MSNQQQFQSILPNIRGKLLFIFFLRATNVKRRSNHTHIFGVSTGGEDRDPHPKKNCSVTVSPIQIYVFMSLNLSSSQFELNSY